MKQPIMGVRPTKPVKVRVDLRVHSQDALREYLTNEGLDYPQNSISHLHPHYRMEVEGIVFEAANYDSRFADFPFRDSTAAAKFRLFFG